MDDEAQGSSPAPAGDNDREDVTIAGQTFSLSNPYEEGHVVSAGEASQLNQVRHENIRNNFAAKVKKAVEDGTLNVEGLQAELDSYDSTYQMGVRTRSGGTGRVADPVQREARSIAKEVLTLALKGQGKKISDVEAATLKTTIDTLLVKHPEWVEKARERVESRRAEAEAAAADLDLGVAA